MAEAGAEAGVELSKDDPHLVFPHHLLLTHLSLNFERRIAVNPTNKIFRYRRDTTISFGVPSKIE